MPFFNQNPKQFNKLICGLVLFSSSALAGDIHDLPDFGDSAGSVISPEYERRLGQLFMKQVRYFSSVSTDPEVESYIQSLGYGLVSHTDNIEQPFNFFVVNNTGINAFAGPGGMIGMNSGVIINSDNESEVAAVMAHEIAHVTQRHLVRMFEELNRYQAPTIAATVGAILVGIVNPQAGIAALAGVQGLAIQNQINFTRENEEEADRIGIQTMVKAGYDPLAMPSFFLKLQRMSRYHPSAPEFLRTHPLTTTRIADTTARAEKFPRREYTNSISYELVKHKLIVSSFENAGEATRHLRGKLEAEGLSEKDKIPIRYGLAYAYIKNNDFSLAEPQVRVLLKNNPDNSAYLLLAAKLYTSQSDYNSAFKYLNKAHELYPDYKPVIIHYSRALLDVEKGKKARDILKNYERFHEHDLTSYSLLGQAEAMLGNHIETAIIHAEYYYLAGETKLAVDKLKFAKQQYQLDYYQEQRISARMAEFKYELELEEKIKI